MKTAESKVLAAMTTCTALRRGPQLPTYWRYENPVKKTTFYKNTDLFLEHLGLWTK